MPNTEISERLRGWFASQLSDARDVAIEGLDRVAFGYSAETLLLTLVARTSGDEERRDVVVRLRPPPPGLLEPYDLHRQFTILRALEPTAVRAPRALWHEGTGEVLGREFYVMERVDGTVYEQEIPAGLEAAPARIRRMSESMAEQIAAIHLVDLHASGLDSLGDGRDYLDRELDRWAGEMQRVRRGRLPALERLLAALRDRQPDPCPRVTLVHGDPKPGNFAFVGDEVHGVFDWEMAAIGDPLADIGWAEVTWAMPVSFTSRPGSLSADEFVARYQDLSGIAVTHREWYRAFQGFKMATILLVGAMLFDRGFSDDLRLAAMGKAVPFLTQQALRELDIADQLEPGQVTARAERVREVRSRLAGAQRAHTSTKGTR